MANMPPRLRSSVDSDLAEEYAEAAQLDQLDSPTSDKLDEYDDGLHKLDKYDNGTHKLDKVDEKAPGIGGPGGPRGPAVSVHEVEPGEPLQRIASVGPPPDGGLRAWLVVVGSAFSMFCVNGFVTGTGQFQAYYLNHQLSSYSTAEVA